MSDDKQPEIRLDGWENVTLGLGVIGVDKTLETKATNTLSLTSPQELVNLYHTDDLVYRIVTTVVKEALSMGFVVKGVDDPTPIYARCKELNVVQKLTQALVWERLLGGSVIYGGFNDGLTGEDSQEKPLRDIQDIHWYWPIDRRYIRPDRNSVVDDVTSVDYNQAALYTRLGRAPSPDGVVGRRILAEQGKIHKSRLIVFKGEDTTDDVREALSGWGISVLDRMMQKLRRNATVWTSAGYMMSESSYNVLKISNLAQLIAGGKEAEVQSRIRMLQYSKGVARTALVGENEDIMMRERTFTGVPDMIRLFMMEVASAAEMPVTKLWGISASGLQATGEGDQDNWTSTVDSYREEKVRPALTEMVTQVAQSVGAPTEDLEIEFPELQPMNDGERAEQFTKLASGAAALVNAQVFHPEEIAISLHEKFGIEIDVNERVEMLKSAEFADQTEPEPVDPTESLQENTEG